MSSRGAWFEAAIQTSNEIYQRRGLACVQKVATPAGMTKRGDFYRARSTVDFLGVMDGQAVAFDAKSVKVPRLPHKNVHAHQRQFLLDWDRAGGVAFLLVNFDELGTYLADIVWYMTIIAERDRQSIPHSRFAEAARHDDEDVFEVEHGVNAVPVHYAVAVDRLGMREVPVF